jgi:uncharacterized membrane protein HdeD (DUF308 family)
MNNNHPFLERINKNAGLAIALGALVALMGVLALSSPLVTGVVVGSVIGFVLLISGFAQLVFAFKAGEGVWPYVVGALTVLAGGYMAFNPAVAAGTLTMVLFIFLLASGIAEILMSLQIRPASGWGWSLVGGILSVVLGFMIWGQFPLSGALAVGVLLGVRLLFSGIALIMLGMKGRGAVKKVEGLAQR